MNLPRQPDPDAPALIDRGSKVVVALGGNALVRDGEEPTIATQAGNVRRAMAALVPLIESGARLVVTHGNGFQVGSILTRVEESLGKAYQIPLEVCVAESQGEIGYLIEQSLQNALTAAGIRMPVVSVLTQVVVDPEDPAFARPTKPIGPSYTKEQADALVARGFSVAHEPGRGWRKVVASPRPLEIDDVEVLEWMLEKPVIVVAAGGGGVPVVRRGEALEGVPAVIDKDRASAILARGIHAPRLIILTGEPAVYRDYRTPNQTALRTLTVDEAESLLREGHFPEGSMGPKVDAAIDFLRAGGQAVTITDAEHLESALRQEHGTTIT